MKRLIVLLGPTGVGKTDLCIDLAKTLDTCVVSCDSRQIFKEMRLGTAVPNEVQLSAVPHYFIQSRSVTEPYDVAQFEKDALAKIRELFAQGFQDVIMCGGSMLYIDALCNGIDDIPSIPIELRNEMNKLYQEQGLAPIQEELKSLDPELYKTIDINNRQRVIHAVEVCRVAGVPFSSLRTKSVKNREFQIVKVGLNRDREELYARIDARVEQMLTDGLENEVRNLIPLREANALATVGYREFFDYFDGLISYDEAVRLIKRNTRHYARKQLTWFKRDASIRWFSPNQRDEIFSYLDISK